MNTLLKRHYCLFVLLLLAVVSANATHNRAGEITFEQLGALTFRVTITTYTKTSSVPADRDSLGLNWGDGSEEQIPRSVEIFLPNDIKKNQYVATHTYPGRGTYNLSMTDPNRNADVLNVNYPNSVNVPFSLQTQLVILNTQFQGTNNSPQLLQPPIDVGCKGQIFMHNPNAFDTEGDSVAYELIVPQQDVNTPVTNYQYPNSVVPGANNQISLDPVTGDFVWDSPQLQGEYNIAILVKEYRRGQLISTIIRDMQILIEVCDNRPPTIESDDEFCVIAGDTLTFPVVGNDPDSGQQIVLSCTGGPLLIQPGAATFNAPTAYSTPPVNALFDWKTQCEHIRSQFYQVVFKAEDNYFGTQGLVTLKTVKIKVMAPPPQNLTAQTQGNQVRLKWDKPYKCADLNRFRGFTVWRKEGCDPFEADTCKAGLDGQGYTKIAQEVLTFDANGYFYIDNTAIRGREYSYRVLGEFTELNSSGQVYSLVSSITSNEVCVLLAQDIPLIINADVKTTDPAGGEVFVRWTRPKAEDLDTLQNPPPYRYDLYRAPGFTGGNFVRIYSATSPTFAQAVDTFFTDTALNTTDNPYRYYVAFFTAGDSLGITEQASTIYLNVAPDDQSTNLTWNETVPWTNQRYTVYRKNNTTGLFDAIGTTATRSYRDEGLENNVNYCYKVKSTGAYNITGSPAPLINYSQEDCAVPRDSTPPCPPRLAVRNQCGTYGNTVPAEDFYNTLSWQTSPDSCGADVEKYNLYYSPSQNGTYTLIGTVNDPHNGQTIEFLHEIGITLSGCYYLTAIDSLEANGGGIESAPSNVVCIDNCPIYDLPNVFTPNGDNVNDTYTPFLPYRYISRIDIKIYNQWGGLVHQNTNPLIAWNGRDLDDKELAESTYFYVCEVWEQRLNGEVKRDKPLTGYIALIRGK